MRRLHVENLVQLLSCQALTLAHIRALGSIKQVDDILICDVISSGGWRGALLRAGLLRRAAAAA